MLHHPVINVSFFILSLYFFILGNESLKELEAKKKNLQGNNDNKEFYSYPIKAKPYEAVNSIIPRMSHLTETKNFLDTLVQNYQKFFVNPYGKSTYSTNVHMEIRTINDSA